MPAPAAPTDFVLTTEADGDPTVTASWNHDGVDLDRFEILRRPVGTTVWESLLMAPAGDFGPGPYELVLASRPGTEYVVRALNSVGEVST